MKLALEGEMMVGSWFVPDETDLLVPVAGKVFRSIKKLKVLDKALEKVNNIGSLSLSAAKKARLAQGKSDNVVIRVVTEVNKEAHLGHLPPGSSRADDAVEDAAKAKVTKYIGQCFVAGTPVTLVNGTLKPDSTKNRDTLVLRVFCETAYFL